MKGPNSIMKKARGFESAGAVVRDRIAQQDDDEATDKTPKRPSIDTITQMLGVAHFYTNWTWTWFTEQMPRGQVRQMYVGRWYPTMKLALDTYPNAKPSADELERREKLVTGNGFKYFCLHADNGLADLIKFLGAA